MKHDSLASGDGGKAVLPFSAGKNDSRSRERVGWRDHAFGAALGTAYVVALLATSRSVGFTRDESFYFRAATNYFGWYQMLVERGTEALRQATIDAAWSDNHEHPALMKTLFGWSWGLLHERWHLTYASTAFRLPAMVLAGVALWVTYVFGVRAWGRTAGLVAAVLLGLMPRVFFHAHLACFDAPIMTMWLVSVYTHWRAQQRRGVCWAVVAGVAFGLALETKHNAWMLPAVFVPHALFVHRRALLRGLRAGRVALPSSLIAMATIGPLVFFALWPYLWNDTLARLAWYVDFHVHHNYYSIEFLGRNVGPPPAPKLYLPVMVVATVPTVTLVLFVVGAVDRIGASAARLRRWAVERTAGWPWARPLAGRLGAIAPARARIDRSETDLLLALAFIVPIAPFFLEKTPVFGGTKHWLTAYPFLALFAGRGAELALGTLRRALPAMSQRAHRALDAGFVASVVAAPLAVTAHSNPFGLSTYVPLVGGTAGGADLGLNRQFWGYTSQNAATEYVDSQAPRNATVYIHDTTYDAWLRMVDEGRVRRDLRAVGAPHEAQIALLEHELHMNEVDYAIWVAFGDDAPVYVVKHDGVPIVSIYRR